MIVKHVFVKKLIKFNRNLSNLTIMELEALLLSDVIPRDIVLNDIYKHLCKEKTLNEKQKISIIHNHFLFKKVVLKYYRNKQLSRNPSHGQNYFLYWLENDLIGVLNDGVPLNYELTENMKKECPGVTIKWLASHVSPEDLPDKTYAIWKLMSNEKKQFMYDNF